MVTLSMWQLGGLLVFVILVSFCVGLFLMLNEIGNVLIPKEWVETSKKPKKKTDYERGVEYIQKEIANGTDPKSLWLMCDPSFDNHKFDKGMADELSRQGIKHPMDPI